MRVSTDDQSTRAQLLKLVAQYPTANINEETMSSMKARPVLNALLGSLVSGDRLIIYSLDRLGRRAHEVLPMLEELKERGITLISMREGVDYTTVSGKLVTQIFVSMAEMERELISERTKAGLAAARDKGKLLGKPREIPEEILKEATRLVLVDGVSIPQAAARFKYIARSGKRKGEQLTLSVSYLRKILKAVKNEL